MMTNNLAELFVKQAERNKNKIAVEYRLRRNEPYRTISWRHLAITVQAITYGLIELGLKKGDNVAILSNTRYEWANCDLAILSGGGVVVPIYPTLPEDSVNYILNNAKCEIIILEDKGQLQKIRSQWNSLPHIKYAVVIEDLGDLPIYDPRILSLRTLKDKGKLNFSKDPYLLQKHIKAISINDLATIIYTSGTTGPPKGVMLTHKNIMSVITALPGVLPINADDKFLSFLPLSHVFERVGGFYYALYCGCTICYCSNIDQIASALKDSKATIMLVVPRLLEKVYSKLQTQLSTLPESKKRLFKIAFDAAKDVLVNPRKQILPLRLFNLTKYKILDKLVFSKIRNKLAPTLKCFVSGGAPLSKDIADFFNIIGIPALEGYGLTETSAPVTVNSFKALKTGTVGKPLANSKIKIAEDGEILIKSPNVFLGYYKNEEATKAAFIDGWFASGDVGIVDEDGFLKITDRKKDIIVNSAGKNIAPQNIENALKASPYISNAVVIGDKRKYLSALLTLEIPSIHEYLKKHNSEMDSWDVSLLYNNSEILKLIDEAIKLQTAPFADYEQIRRFTVLPKEFTIESGEITPTLKVKRKFVEQKYKHLIDSMYPSE